MHTYREIENLEYYSKCYFIATKKDIERIKKWCNENKINIDQHFLIHLPGKFYKSEFIWLGIDESRLFFSDKSPFPVRLAVYNGASIYRSFDEFLLSEHVKRISRIHNRPHIDAFKLPFIVSPRHMKSFSNRLYKEYRSNNPNFDDFLKRIFNIINIHNNARLSILIDFLRCDNVETDQITSSDSYLKYFINLYNKGLTPNEVVNHLNIVANIVLNAG